MMSVGSFPNSASADFEMDILHAVQRDTIFQRKVVAPAKNGTATVSEMEIGWSNATSSVTLLNLEDAEKLAQIHRNRDLIDLLDEWIAHDPDEPDDDLEQQMRTFEEDRPASRRLF